MVCTCNVKSCISWQRVGLQPRMHTIFRHAEPLPRCKQSKYRTGDVWRMHRTSNKDGGRASVDLNRKDMLLVLTKDVELGEELLTQYETDIESEEIQLKLLLQYGTPPPQ